MTEVFFNPFDPSFRENPYPQYDLLREHDPVHKSLIGAWVLTRYGDVQALLRSPAASTGAALGNENREAMLEAQGVLDWYRQSMLSQYMVSWMLTLDPPDHTRVRGLVSKVFTPRAIEAMRPHIQHLVDDLLDGLDGAGTMEVVDDLAFPLPALVICELLGVPGEDRDHLKQWSHDAARLIDPMTDFELMEKADGALRGFTDYFSGLVAERRKHPRDDVLTALATAEDQGQRLTDQELMANAIFLFVAGHETTTNLITNGVYNLLRYPAELDKLRADLTLAAGAVEEVLRFESPIQMTGRGLTQDVELPDVTIPAGERCVLLLGAANRDPAQFDDPNRFDVTRQDVRPLSFGGGLHHCLGAALARVEGQVTLGTLVRRYPKLELATDTPRWKETFTLRGLAELPVDFAV